MTDAEFIAWAKSPSSLRCVLVEVDALVGVTETTFYLSNHGYVTSATDTPANTAYKPDVTGDIEFTERLSLDGAPAVSWGGIEIFNVGGYRDEWLTYVWRNRSVKVYVGDVRWQRSDFRLVIDGLIDNISERTNQRLNLAIRDKMQRLNCAVTETLLGGSTANKDRLIPVALGECHNVEPLLTDPATLSYQVHGDEIERIIEVRDQGVPVTTTDDLATGSFTLDAAPKGQVTVSVQGDEATAYLNTVAGLVHRLATGYGNDPLDGSEIDTDNFDDFDADNPQPVGLYLSDRANVLECCQRLAASVGAQVVMSSTGLLRLVKIALPAGGAATTANATNMRKGSLSLADRVPVVASIKLGYCPNWTVQTNLQTGIPAEHKDLYGQEWLTVTASDSAVATAYKLPALPPEQQDTLLLVETDAQDEADRRLALWSTQRNVYAFDAFPELMLTELGAAMTVTHERYGMSAGVTGQVIGIQRGYISGHVRLQVLA